LPGGSRLRGTILADDGDGVLLRHPTLGELRVPQEAIAERLAADAQLGPAAAEAEIVPPPPGILGTSFLEGWEKTLILGFSGSEGAVSEFGLNASVEADVEDEFRRWRLRASYFYGSTESELTQDEGSASARRDWLLPGNPLFWFAESRTDYDAFQPYTLRAGGFTGVGLTVYGAEPPDAVAVSENLSVLTRLGAGYSYEWGEIDDGMAEALAAVELRWNVTDSQTFRLTHTYFPDLQDFVESRNVTEASYSVKIDRARGLGLRLGLRNEYLSRTAGDSPHNSLTYFGQVTYSF
jgi:hypothetical protein